MLPHQRHSSTSLQAALDFTDRALGARLRVFLAIQSLNGATDEEIQDLLCMNPNTQRPRRVELVRAGLIEDSGHTKWTKSKAQAVIWVAIEGAEYQESLFRTVNRPKLQGLAKAVAEVERAIPKGVRSCEVQKLLARLHEELSEIEVIDSFDLDEFVDELAL